MIFLSWSPGILWICSGSSIALPTVRRGSSDAYGSWKTICISRRNGRRSSQLSPTSSLPLYFTEPALGGISCRTQRPSVDLPEPLSPTSPSVSRRPMVNDTSDTAWTSRFVTRTPFRPAHREHLDELRDLDDRRFAVDGRVLWKIRCHP